MTGVPRRVNVKPVAGKATVCIGVRRSGKSTFLFQLMQRLIDGGVARQNILYLNFFDDRLHGLQHERLGVILEDAYVLFTVRIFDASLARANINPKKIYCIDHALVTSTSSGILVNTGHLLENLVFTALRRTTPEIFYFKTKSGREVDFVVQGQNRSHRLVQVCESMVDPRTRKREITSLSEAMAELNLSEGTIVTRGENEQIQVTSGKIYVVPAWRFLLNVSVS